jgi:uncharacterized protein YecE (DUF72 family)
MMPVFIGTSGWAYREWRSRFYPAQLRTVDQLAFYVTRFASVEINGTAYRTPTADTVRRWSEAMPAGFIAAVKLAHGITHYRRLRHCRGSLVRFMTVARELGAHRGPVLAQLPPGFGPDLGLLRDFLDEAREVMADPAWPLVVEFRHPGWITEQTAAVLDGAGATWCLADMPDCPTHEPTPRAGVLYVRRHGTTGKYRGSYEDRLLRQDADLLGAWAERGGSAYAYFNNTADGAAVEDALRLQELVAAASGARRERGTAP